MKTTYVIMTGMHRTGTSMISGAMGICGLDIGTHFRKTNPPGNPKGYFENLDFKQINLRLMRNAGIGPGSFVFPKKWDIVDYYGDNPNQRNEMVVFVDFWDRGHPVGWKDPRACLTLGIWKKYIPNLKIITISRPAIEIANSLKTRTPSWSIEFGFKSTEIYLEHLERHCEDVPRVDVQYHDFFKNKTMRNEILSGLCDFVGVDSRSRKWSDKIDGFIDNKLWRERQAAE